MRASHRISGGVGMLRPVDQRVSDVSATGPGAGLPAAVRGQRYLFSDVVAPLHASWGSVTGLRKGDIVQRVEGAWVIEISTADLPNQTRIHITAENRDWHVTNEPLGTWEPEKTSPTFDWAPVTGVVDGECGSFYEPGAGTDIQLPDPSDFPADQVNCSVYLRDIVGWETNSCQVSVRDAGGLGVTIGEGQGNPPAAGETILTLQDNLETGNYIELSYDFTPGVNNWIIRDTAFTIDLDYVTFTTDGAPLPKTVRNKVDINNGTVPLPTGTDIGTNQYVRGVNSNSTVLTIVPQGTDQFVDPRTGSVVPQVTVIGGGQFLFIKQADGNYLFYTTAPEQELDFALSMAPVAYMTRANLDFAAYAAETDDAVKRTMLQAAIDVNVNDTPVNVTGVGAWRVAFKNQTNTVENGVYRVDRNTLTVTRFTDFAAGLTVPARTWMFITRGKGYINEVWNVFNDTTPSAASDIDVGTHGIFWQVVTSPGNTIGIEGIRAKGSAVGLDLYQPVTTDGDELIPNTPQRVEVATALMPTTGVIETGEWIEGINNTNAALTLTTQGTDEFVHGQSGQTTNTREVGPGQPYKYMRLADDNFLVVLGDTAGYIRPANGSTLKAGERYILNTGIANTPANPVDGAFFYVRNDSDLITGGDLSRGTLVGPLTTLQGDAIPGFSVAPGLEFLLTYDGTAGRWKAALQSEVISLLDSSHNGQELRGIGIYEITGDAAGMSFKFPATPAGHLALRLAAGSTFPVTINQFDTGAADQVKFESGERTNTFVLDVAHAGQTVDVTGEPFSNTWYTYRDWEIANINANAAPWKSEHDYTVGEIITQNRLSDGQLTFFAWDDSAANGGTPTDGTSGTTWDATEEDRWIEVGEAPVNIEIFQSVDIDVTGYLSSWTQVDAVTLIDAAGNDYDSATDWRITGDSAGLAVIGSFLGNQDLSHTVVNSTRTVTLTYVGTATRRGLSAIRATHGHPGSTSGITRVKSTYFSGVTQTFARTGGVTGIQTTTLTDTHDFLTNPQLANDLNVQYMTAASGLFWYSADNFIPNQLVTLVTDADNHQVTISNNSGLQGLKVIDTDGTVTETVNPALQGSTNSVDLDPLSIYHAWLDDATVLHVRKVGGTGSAKNALVYPVGNFTALAVNDSGTGADGVVYKLPTVDALQITLPNKADMNAAEGIYRVRISGDWAALSTQTTVLSFIDDTANGVDMGTGLPDDGNEWLDLVFDAANDKWIATSGGEVTLEADPLTTGPAIERVVAIKSPGFGTILGDFNFMMPGGGNRSIQIRTVSGIIAHTDFNTYWSAGAGGDNDAPFAGNWDETWRYAADVNMTAHNHYQHVEFIANGWFYHIHMVVGPGFNDNRFTLTRWRMEGVKGDTGTKAVLISGSLGPGAGGAVNVPLANDGKALFDVAMKLSNGTSFSPPLDVDDGANRWWYDFDHTTGVITASRFGAFTGGAYRIVAYYA